jgi:hypothetical protein
VTFETALNLLWCSIGVLALLGLYFSERRKGSSHSLGRRRRTLAVLLATVSLFPCVSATDDEFCFSLLQTRTGSRGGVGAPLPEESRDQVHHSLGRLFETLGHYEVSSTYAFAVIFGFIGLVLLAANLTSGSDLVLRAGRSPPLSSLA